MIPAVRRNVCSNSSRACADLIAQLRGLGRDLLHRACALVDPPQLGFELGPDDARERLRRALARLVQDVVRRVEHGAEQVELARQDLEHESLGLVVVGEEVHDGHVALLAVAMAATDALLDALRIPRQVVVHHRVAELQVQPLRAGLGRDEHVRARRELVDQREPHRDRRG